jgi:hypothetical protein
VLGRALGVGAGFDDLLLEHLVVHSLLIPSVSSSTHDVQISDALDNLAHLCHRTDLVNRVVVVKRVLWVLGRSHRCPRFRGLTTTSTSFALTAFVLVCVGLGGALGSSCSVVLNELLDFRLTNTIKPRFSQSFGSSKPLLLV